jgi:hypothetical protein
MFAPDLVARFAAVLPPHAAIARRQVFGCPA